MPYRMRNDRYLAREPLTAEDWERVYLAYQGFNHQVRLIVKKARERAKAPAETGGPR